MTRLAPISAVLLALLLPAIVTAHPLGNFSVNRWAGLTVTPTVLVVRYAVDMAEIPAYQTIDALDGDRNGTLDAAERAAYLARVPEELAGGLALTVDGAPLVVVPGEARLEFSVARAPGGAVLVQRARFRPNGRWGRLYWYGVFPAHLLIFGRMARAIARAAEAPHDA